MDINSLYWNYQPNDWKRQDCIKQCYTNPYPTMEQRLIIELLQKIRDYEAVLNNYDACFLRAKNIASWMV